MLGFDLAWGLVWTKVTLNYRVILEGYPFPNGVIGGSIPAAKFSLYLTKKN